MPNVKIAVIGDINGQFRAVFQKLGTLHKKNAFSFALVIGNLFAHPENTTAEDGQNVQDLINGDIEIGLPMYFALGSNPLPAPIVDAIQASEGGQVCSNLFYLGKRSTTKTSDGVRIVALGGSVNTNIAADSKDSYLPSYTENDAKTLKGATYADVLVTSQWPSGIRTGSKLSIGEHEEPTSHQCISELNAALRPKYHFSLSPDIFYERESFFHAPREDAPNEYHITRFISLAAFNNPAKAKWIYAFSLDPSAPVPTSLPAGTSASPFAFINRKRQALPDQDSLRFPNNDFNRHERPRKRTKHKKGPPPTQGECYFCLSNPNLPTHIVTSIGTEAYLTTAKGPLSTSKTYPSIDFPAHILIIPMSHAPTLSLIPDIESRETTRSEMNKYRKGIQDMLASESKDQLGAVTWEISRASGFHTHWQILPLPASAISKGLVEAAFRVEAENKSHPRLEKGEPDEAVDYYRVWIYDPITKKDTSLYMPLDSDFRDLQYARRVLAKLLNLEGRIMWQDCGQTLEDEVKDAESFKEKFKSFDFTEE